MTMTTPEQRAQAQNRALQQLSRDMRGVARIYQIGLLAMIGVGLIVFLITCG